MESDHDGGGEGAEPSSIGLGSLLARRWDLQIFFYNGISRLEKKERF